jgi:hypothetical protein
VGGRPTTRLSQAFKGVRLTAVVFKVVRHSKGTISSSLGVNRQAVNTGLCGRRIVREACVELFFNYAAGCFWNCDWAFRELIETDFVINEVISATCEEY